MPNLSSLLPFIDPLIGSGGIGFGAGGINPGAQLPHGMMRLGPDTALLVGGRGRVVSFEHYGGYSHTDDAIRAFSHTHLVGAGVGDYGNFGTLPVRLSSAAAPDSELSALLLRPEQRAVRFSHAQERATPGAYAVNLSAPAVEVHLGAAGTHAGVHSYTFAAATAASGDGCGLLLDVCATAMAAEASCQNASVELSAGPNDTLHLRASLVMAGALTERKHSAGGGAGVPLHWSATLAVAARDAVRAPPPAAWRLWASGALAAEGATAAHAPNASLGALVRVGCGGSYLLHAAISFVSPAQADANLRVQAPPTLTLEQATAAAAAQWAEAVDGSVKLVDAADASATTLRAFSTALYHARFAPSVWDEAGGVYLGMDGAVRSVGAGGVGDDRRAHAYTDMSLWDIHRTQLPWLSLTAPKVYEDVVRSLQAMGEEGGDVPRWPLGSVYTGCMVGNHALPVVAEAVAKGHGGFNATSLFEMLRRHATQPRPHAGREGLAEWLQYGYVPDEAATRAASLTLAYAFDDGALASLASALGRCEDAALFRNRSRRAVLAGWSEARQLMCPRTRTGALRCPLDPKLPYPFEKHYVEGSALQWLWFVPHDPLLLVQLFGSNASFVAKLDAFMVDARRWPLGNSMPNGYGYWADNEPDLLAPWLYAFAGAQHRAANTTRWLTEHKYSDAADGVPGNDDFGTLSAWLVWATLGLYPLAGSDGFVVGSPRFGEVELRSPDGQRLTIRAHNASAANTYVERAALDGQLLATPFVRFRDLIGGATLECWMSDRASRW